MSALIVISCIVLVISLYDYYTSRTWLQVTSTARNNVVFESRNKAYGAYKIRNDYNRNLILILSALFFTFLLIIGVFYYKSSKIEKVNLLPDTSEFVTSIIEFPLVLKPKEENLPALTQKIKTKQFVTLIPTDAQTTTSVETQEGLVNQQVGNTTSGGDDGTSGNAVGGGTSNGGEGNDANTNEVIEDFVDIEASYPGGHKEMMRYLSKNIHYPEIAVLSNIQGKTTLRFVVGSNGTIESVSVLRKMEGCPECDAEAIRVIKNMPKWVPAKKKGKVVKSYFTLPIVYKLQ
ncbi:MAG: energy transducer TonB [Crocinitomicaceae bacterium]|nr:energy transducer TonB [Crocinitomicaceae bacterium]